MQSNMVRTGKYTRINNIKLLSFKNFIFNRENRKVYIPKNNIRQFLVSSIKLS